MAIIKYLSEYNAPQEVLLNLYPDQFVSEGIGLHEGFGLNTNRQLTFDGREVPIPNQHTKSTTKRSENWWKINMDYWYTVALAQYNVHRLDIVRNYELMKGRITAADFYLEGPVMSLVDEMMKDVDLPAYVQHYPILNPPINTMVGEKSKRPDVARPKCGDSDSLSEEADYYTNLYQEYVMSQVRSQIIDEQKSKGADLSNLEGFQEQIDQLTAEKMQQYMMSYASQAEIWAGNMLQSLKREFNMKEHFEGGFRDMLICNRQFYHNYEDRSKTGFKCEKVNPKNVWFLTTPDKKYTRDAYAAGLIEIMELSEILDKFDLTDDEIDHLRKIANQAFFPYSRPTNLETDQTGQDTIKYNAYDPLVLRERNYMESQLNYNNGEPAGGFLGNAASNVAAFGNRFVVTTAYWKSKRKIGLLTYKDIDGNVQSMMVDDTYKNKSHPKQMSIRWKWENQWFKGVKIGYDIYYVKPLEILDYCPIVGVVHEIENTISTSLIDLMKPLQTIYNVSMNQIYRMLEKEKGKGFVMNRNYIPIMKGVDYEESVELWERMFEETGVVWIDDSPTNRKGSPGTFNQYTTIDLTLTDQIRSRMEFCTWIKNECWELVGINRQRTGATTASESATGVNTAVTQSYAQTEPYFVQQEYIENQQLQCMLDIAQYIECQNPESTIAFVDDQGGNVFCKIQTEAHLKNRDIKLFMTNRQQDQEVFKNLQMLAQPAMQNGASLYEVAQMYTQNSTRALMDTYKKLHDRMIGQQQQEQQMQQQQLEQNQQQMQQQAQQFEQQRQDQLNLETYKIDKQTDTQWNIAQLKERIEIAKMNRSTEGDDGYEDLITLGFKQQDQLYRENAELAKQKLEQQKLQLQQQQNNIQNAHAERKLDLQAEGNQIKKEQVKKQAAQKKATAK